MLIKMRDKMRDDSYWPKKFPHIALAIFILFPLLTEPKNLALLPEEPPAKIPYKIVNTYPHPPGSFTQGLVFEDGFLYEGTGQYGSSCLRKIKLETGEIVKEARLPRQLFGEGITIFKDKIIQLTWLSQIGLVYDKQSFQHLDTFQYPIPIEGWGMTTDGEHLIVSDGSSKLYFLNPESYEVKSRLEVRDTSGPVHKINELEYADGAIYANIWQSAKIIKIDINSGRITGFMDLSELIPEQYKGHSDYVLNGIAYDYEKKRFFVTGKMWPHVFALELLVAK